MMHQAFLNCVGPTDLVPEFYARLQSQREELLFDFEKLESSFMTALPLEARRWKALSANAFHLVCILVDDSYMNPCFFCEESARLFCEAAFYCYSVGMETRGHKLQRLSWKMLKRSSLPIMKKHELP